MLSDGEFVMNAAATLRNRAILEAINADRAPAMTAGGIVGKSSRAASGGDAFVMGDIIVNGQSTGSSGDPRMTNSITVAWQQVAAAIDQQMTEWTANRCARAACCTGSANANSSCKLYRPA
jgi:hypothetical protein